MSRTTDAAHERERARPVLMPIERAGLKVQREYMLRERRNSRIAILVLIVVGATFAYGIFRVLGV